MTNELELKAECVKKGMTLAELANKIGVDASTLYRKFKGGSEFSRNEMQIIRSVLELSDERFLEIFFD